MNIELKQIASLLFLLVISNTIGANQAAEIDCLIEPNTVVKIGTREEGVIEYIAVDRGDFIAKGQLVARLESGVEEATLEMAKTASKMIADIEAKQVSVNFNQRNEKRQHELFVKKVIADHQFDKAQTEEKLSQWELRKAKDNKRLAELEMQRAEAALNRRIILSPIRGVVTERIVSVGEAADLQPLISVAELNPLKVEVIAPISMYGSIQTGMEAVIKPEAPIGGEYQATVKIIDPVIDAASGTFGVRLELPNPDYKLPGGLKCKIAFQSQSAEEQNKAVEKISDPSMPSQVSLTQPMDRMTVKN